jgi:hypothetical protein
VSRLTLLLLLLLLQTELTAYEKFSEPREVDVLRVIPNKKEMGTAFKKVRCQQAVYVCIDE